MAVMILVEPLFDGQLRSKTNFLSSCAW